MRVATAAVAQDGRLATIKIRKRACMRTPLWRVTPPLRNQVSAPHNSQAATKLDSSAVQGSVDQAIVDALLSMLSAMAHNQKMPKNVLNQLIDFLQNYLSGGGTKPVEGGDTGGSNPVVGTPPVSGGTAPQPEIGAPVQNDAVHLDHHGASVMVGDQEVVMWNVRSRPPEGDGKIYLTPGRSVTIGDTQVVADSPYKVDFPPPSMPVDPGWGVIVPGPGNTTQPAQPQQPIIGAEDFVARFTTPLQMRDGTWARVTNELAQEAFGIPQATPLSQVKLGELKWQPGAEGTVSAPTSGGSRSVSTTDNAQPTAAQSELNTKMQEAGALLQKVNSGKADKFDVNDFISKLQDIARLFAEAVGDGAQAGARKTKSAERQVQAAKTGGAGGGGEGGKSVGGSSGGLGTDAQGGSVGGGGDLTAGNGITDAASGTDTSNGVAPGYEGSTTGKSWLMAIAEAMGSVLGSKVQQMLTSSSKMSSLTIDQKKLASLQKEVADKVEAKNKEAGVSYDDFTKWKEREVQPGLDKIEAETKLNGQRFTEESSKLQGASQEFSMLQNAFSNTIKSIGEGLGQLARKG